jgi:protease YdgD
MIKNDWAVLTLEHALNLTPIPIRPVRNAELPGSAAEEQIVLPGYGIDRPELLSISRGCTVKTDANDFGKGSLEFACEIDFGGSGSPVLLLEHGKAAIVGIATNGFIQHSSRTAHGGAGASATEFEQAILFANRRP